MFLADYHTHSRFSNDGTDPVPDMLRAAEKRGLSELCVTDHCDIALRPFDGNAYWRMLDGAAAQNKTGVRLLRGIELGEGFWDKKGAEALMAAYPYDFVIGSVHTLRGEDDFYFIHYDSAGQCYDYLDRYWADTLALCAWGGFDVLGHLFYPLRYMRGRQGFSLPDVYGRYENELRRIFEILCQKGRGIELNLSGLYRAQGGGVLPPPEILALYRRCGGEIVTLGSDAHTARDVGSALREGTALLEAAGFGYVTAYEGRKPRFEKII